MSNEARAVVTGSSAGIGAAIAQTLLDQGWAVTGLDRSAPTIKHARFQAVEVDLADPAATGRGWLQDPTLRYIAS